MTECVGQKVGYHYMKKRRPRIIFFSHESKLYGAPRSLLLAAKGLSEDYYVCIVTFGDGDLVEASKDAGVPVYVLEGSRFPVAAIKNRLLRLLLRLANKLTDPLRFLYALSLVGFINPDLIYVNTIAKSRPVKIAKVLGRKHIVHVREGSNYIFPENESREKITNYIFRNTVNYVCVSDSIKYLVGKRLCAGSVIVERVYNGISCDDFCSEHKRKFRVKDEKAVVGFLGGLSFRKGFDVFLGAAEEILRDRDDIVFFVVGGSRETFLQFLDAHGLSSLEGVSIFHQCFVQDPAGAFAEFDVFCMTSRIEPFARVNLEAACMKTPIIATSIDGNSEFIVHNETGLLVPPGDSSALADAVRDLVDHKDKALNLAENANLRVNSEFRLDVYVKEIGRCIDTVLSS